MEALKKRDIEYNPLIAQHRPFEIWSTVDSLGRKIIWNDGVYKIAVDSYKSPTLLRLFAPATKGEKVVGELICSSKELFGKKYIYLNFVTVDSNHRGQAYSHRMVNCLLSILNNDIEGIITNYESRKNPKPMRTFFEALGGFINTNGYLEIKNPKNATNGRIR